ncbi:MAG TPA: hypothetical protein VKA84_15360, partial [Gemmatimonadaceae bacterium]|nr:hypothetical protein [Gemmatimonadaceae bacterium]
FLTWAAACRDERPAVASPESKVNQEWVTGAAAAALNPNGQFVLPPPETGPEPELSEGQAVTLATAFIRFHGPWLRGAWEADHGAPVDLAALSRCGRTYYAATPYEPVPEGTSESLRLYYGSQWLVTFCAPSGVPQVSVSVSALATDLRVEKDHIAPQPLGFFAVGIPLKYSTIIPITPEAAVKLAAQATGRRVSAIPQLIMAAHPSSPQVAKWRVVLDLPVQARGTHSARALTTREFYVGPDDSWQWIGLQIPDPTVQRQQTFKDGVPGAEIDRPLGWRSGFPDAYEHATPGAP